jgi:hypothetical protein
LHWNREPVIIESMVPTDAIAQLEARRLKREAERLSLQRRLAELVIEGEQDAVALKVLRQLDPQPIANGASNEAPDRLHATGITTPPGTAASDIPFKTMILSVLQAAYPNGLTAAQIKAKAVLKYKREINSNTLTVTLVRASKDKDDQKAVVRCEGRTWYSIPQPELPNVRPTVRAQGIFG